MPELVDLSQPWGPKLSPWPGGDAPRVWRKSTLNTDGVNEQEIRTDTHIDAPRHFVSGGGDVAGLSLDGKLFGEGVVADISDDVSNERVKIGAFPWKFVGGDACICRIVAFRGW